MLYWHEKARELHAMATPRAREAELVLKKEPGPMNEFVKQMRLLIHQLHEAAASADVRANELPLSSTPASRRGSRSPDGSPLASSSLWAFPTLTDRMRKIQDLK